VEALSTPETSYETRQATVGHGLVSPAEAQSLAPTGPGPPSEAPAVPARQAGRLTSRALKRTADVVLASAGLLLLAPYFAYVAARIKRDSPGPVFFRQSRVGRGGESFRLLKFRTMCEDADARKAEVAALNTRTDGLFKVKDDPRVTDYGRRLRRFSLDELPQLVNVLRGDMSLVGPRPLIAVESALVGDHYRARFAVRPGITGPWQAGPSNTPLSEMLELDYDYALGWTIGGDVKLLLRTARVIAQRRGAD
jgi:lipopolysaccharide/colanic/teichoic acid biosynthesis glycosyltransferase